MSQLRVTIHVNETRFNQVAAGKVLAAGFKARGALVDQSSARVPDYSADVNVVLGPHYALKQHLEARGELGAVLMLDRCYWGNPQAVVTLNWLDLEGHKQYPELAPGDRNRPDLRPWRTQSEKALCIEDYGRTIPAAAIRPFFHQVETRPHPAGKRPDVPLGVALERNDVAIGYTSTALVEAAINGLPIVCLQDDGQSAVAPIASKTPNVIIRPDREQWLANLSYTNWSYDEIESGEAAEFLLCQ